MSSLRIYRHHLLRKQIERMLSRAISTHHILYYMKPLRHTSVLYIFISGNLC
jgi:hypothetical protein